MGIPVLFIVFILLLMVFQYCLHRNDVSHKNAKRKFWNYEESSWFARKSTIEADLYLHPNTTSLPRLSLDEFEKLEKPSLFKIQEDFFKLSTEPMVDLSNLLNSELRHKYGAANLEAIQTYETNYANYVKHLYTLGQFYFSKEHYPEALAFLEEGLHVKTEISDHLILLGNLYCKTNDKMHFLELYEYATHLNSLTKNKIINQLNILKEANF